VCTGGCDAQKVCTIDCIGMTACEGATIDCPPGYACHVICDGQDSCDTATINCPPEYACDVTCTGGNDACGDVNMNCTDGSCYVQCDADACAGMVVACGTGACSADCQGMPAPQVDCAAACACQGC
jgi:hypothetical protein